MVVSRENLLYNFSPAKVSFFEMESKRLNYMKMELF